MKSKIKKDRAAGEKVQKWNSGEVGGIERQVVT